MIEKLQKKSIFLIIGMFLLLSIVLIGLLSYSSPIYEFNYSGDNNNYMTVGKAMMHGFVPYKDVFEQKGPFVYLLYGLASLISFHTFLGSAIFEIAILFAILWLTFKIGKLFSSTKVAFVIALFAPVFVLMEPYYSYGATVEFFLYPAMLSLIYVSLKAQQHHFIISKWTWYFQGCLVGIVFFSKYTLLGSWIAFYISMFMYYTIKHRWNDVRNLIWSSGLGFLTTTVPWLIYFEMVHGLKQFFNVYFYTNIFRYGSVNGTWFERLSMSLWTFVQLLLFSNPVITFVIVLGLLFVFFSRKILAGWIIKSLLMIMMFTNALLALCGGTFGPYYLLAYFPYILVLFVLLIIALSHKLKLSAFKKWQSVFIFSWVFALCMTLSVNSNLQFSRFIPNNPAITSNLGVKHPTSSAQIEFGRIMRHESKGRPTLLAFGFLENGFYTTSGAYPTIHYFERNNISYHKLPTMMNTAANAIKHRKVQWVVICVKTTSNSNLQHQIETTYKKNAYGRGLKALNQNYEMRAHHSQISQGNDMEYVLYKLK